MQSGQPGKPIQAETRLVTVDVVATDSHGNAIRGLKPEDFEVSDGGARTIEKFAFIDGFKGVTHSPEKPPAPRSYTNQSAVGSLAFPPTVVVIDSLNTATSDLVQTRRHMLDLLKTLPTDTPVAVLLLGTSLHLIQNFTTDPSLLRAAIDRASRSPSVIKPMPQDDPNSLSLLQTEMNDNQEDDDINLLEDFEKETYANEMDIRVSTTSNALRAIAGFLRVYPGRKNLIWISESFPLVLVPDNDFGSGIGSQYPNSFSGTRAYNEQTQEAANALTDARVAIYPVDARGLDTDVITASQHIVSVPGSRSRNPAAQLGRIHTMRMMSQSSMEQLADGTGGRTCKGTNDLSGCVESAIRDSSSYYELAYSPEGIKWDGRFRKISVKVHRSGVKLAYRRGYYAQDESQAAKQAPEQRLREACEDFLPATAIPISAKAVAPDRLGDASYRISIPASAFSTSQNGNSYELTAMLASCVFPPAGNNFTMTTHDLSATLSASQYAEFQASGVQGPADYPLQGAARFRIAVVDEASGSVGALDIPVRLADFAVPAPPAALPAPPARE